MAGHPSESAYDNTTILVADDDPGILGVTATILEGAGYKVLLAEGGRQAVEIFASAKSPIQLLLTDVVMPDLNGPALAARLHAQDPRLKVLFISGFHDAQFVQRSEGGGFSLLAKPFSREALLRAVRDCLVWCPA